MWGQSATAITGRLEGPATSPSHPPFIRGSGPPSLSATSCPPTTSRRGAHQAGSAHTGSPFRFTGLVEPRLLVLNARRRAGDVAIISGSRKSNSLHSRGIFSKKETAKYELYKCELCARVDRWPRTTTSSAGPVEWRRRAALESRSPGQTTRRPYSGPVLHTICCADRPARAARPAHLPHPRGGWCFTLVWRTSETIRSSPAPRGLRTANPWETVTYG
jgi:hypothetical protein